MSQLSKLSKFSDDIAERNEQAGENSDLTQSDLNSTIVFRPWRHSDHVK